MNRKRMSNFFGRLMRVVGPWLPEHKIGRENLRGGLSRTNRRRRSRRSSRGVWENLGRVGAEFAHLDRIDGARPRARRRRRRRSTTGSRSSASWRSATAASRRSSSPRISPTGKCRRSRPPSYNINSNLLYRRPNIGAIADAVIAMRARLHGQPHSDRPRCAGAPRERARARRACRHAGRPAFRARASTWCSSAAGRRPIR